MNTISDTVKNCFVSLRSAFLTAFGNVKVFKYPFWLVYDPSEYRVDGEAIESVLKTLKPGDCLLRGYDSYLDGFFIPQMSGVGKDKARTIGKGWSHGAVYIGNNTVIHAVAEGVQKIHLYDFIKCDRIAVMRPSKGTAQAIRKAKELVDSGTEYDFDFSDKDQALYCFELVAKCYPDLDIRKYAVKKMLGLLKRDVYLAQSFVDSDDFQTVYCHNPKSGIVDRRFRSRKTKA